MQVGLFSCHYYNKDNSYYVRLIRILSPCKSDVRNIGLISPYNQIIARVPNLLLYLHGAYGEHTGIILDWVVLSLAFIIHLIFYCVLCCLLRVHQDLQHLPFKVFIPYFLNDIHIGSFNLR